MGDELGRDHLGSEMGLGVAVLSRDALGDPLVIPTGVVVTTE